MSCLTQLLNNHVLVAILVAWGLAQLLKLPIEYWVTRKWNWGILFSSGGMPSSHSALITSATLALGLYQGFDSPIFALAIAISMVVLYDAAGVRREAGYHAEKINMLIKELLQGHPISEQRLKEMIGHTPKQVFFGAILGLFTGWFVWLIWH